MVYCSASVSLATLELLERVSVARDGLPLDTEAPEGLSSVLTLGQLEKLLVLRQVVEVAEDGADVEPGALAEGLGCVLVGLTEERLTYV